MAMVPYVVENTKDGEKSYDLFSRLMKDRIVLCSGEVDDASMAILTGQLLFLNNESSTEPIHLYLMSPGGSCNAGLAAIDVMKFISAPVYTYCIGYAASMGAALLSSGEPGHRYSLPNSEIMCHQSSGGTQGTITDAVVSMENWKKLNDRLAAIIARNCGMTLKKYLKTVERDNWMWPEEAISYGIIDGILTHEGELPITLKDAEKLKEFTKTAFSGITTPEKVAEKISKDKEEK